MNNAAIYEPSIEAAEPEPPERVVISRFKLRDAVDWMEELEEETSVLRARSAGRLHRATRARVE